MAQKKKRNKKYKAKPLEYRNNVNNLVSFFNDSAENFDDKVVPKIIEHASGVYENWLNNLKNIELGNYELLDVALLYNAAYIYKNIIDEYKHAIVDIDGYHSIDIVKDRMFDAENWLNFTNAAFNNMLKNNEKPKAFDIEFSKKMIGYTCNSFANLKFSEYANIYNSGLAHFRVLAELSKSYEKESECEL